MAKKAPQFNSDYAKNKWAKLENTAGTSIDRIARGQASTADIQKVSSTLGQLSSVAKTVFDEAVEAAEKTALQVREAGKLELREGLTEFELALNSALQVSFKNVVEQIKDILELDLLEQTEELSKTIGSSFENIASLLPPKDLPTVDDLLSNNELIFEGLEQSDLAKWEQRADDLLDRIYHMFSETLGAIKVNPKALAVRGSSYAKGRRHVMNPYQLEDSKTIADKAQELVGEPATDVEATEVETSPVNMVGGVKNEVEEPEEQLSPHDALLARLENMLNKHESRAPPFGSHEDIDVKDSKKEREKADTWWKSFKGWIGDKFDHGKKKVGTTLKNLFKDLGTVGLLSLLFNPQLWKTLADKIQEYVTWDNIKGAALGTWNWLEKQADTVVDWVTQKLGIDKHEKLAQLTPNAKKQLATMPLKDRLSGLGPDQQGIELDSMTPAQRDQAFKEMPQLKAVYENWQKKKAQGTQHSTELEKWWGGVKDTASTGMHQIGSNLSNLFSGGNSRSALPSSISPNGGPPSNTTINNNASNVRVTPGVSLAPQGYGGASAAPNAGTPSVTGSPQIGMASFGFHSSIDDSLLLMNSSFLGS